VFDLEEFLLGRNTLYVLGKEKKHGSIAPIVTAMMEDIFDETRKIASRMPGSRLDPPLTVELNEAAHIAPLPNLPGYMGDSGGFSIALHVYLQSLSQARSRWGEHEAMIMWDNAAVRIIMGGAGNVDDLDDISRLMGDVLDHPKTTPQSARYRRVLSAEEIRTLEFGTAVIVARSARPVEVQLTPWWKRKDGREISEGKSHTEKMILHYAK
jgi:type IV secretory pathway TraG/TraD family ATPase VirD4